MTSTGVEELPTFGVKKTILFIEDEDELLTTVGALLRDQGYQVLQTVRAEEALLMLKESKPDLILADIKLPGIDGFDLFRAVQGDEKLRKIPFMFLTAYNDMKAQVYAKQHGAAEYITKPFDFEYLIARIRDLCPLG